MQEPPVRVGDVVGDKYRIDEFLGSGAMSVVALAYHLELEQEVAIKFLHAPGFDHDQRAQRFKREARAAARIQSEHVARVLDVGTLPDGCPYIVMERLRGLDLAGELAARGPLPPAEIAAYVLEACEALAEAHAAGIVHRDLKPENLFLAERPDGIRSVKLLDFGISKSMMGRSLTDLALTRTASFMGSPLYMSPEQMRSSRSVDARADIWSIGTILYEAVSGRVPFSAESIPELCLSVIGDKPKSLTELCPGLAPGFEAIVERCLEKDREHRYANVAELAQALAPFAPAGPASAARAERILTLSLAPSEQRTTPATPYSPASFDIAPASASLAPVAHLTEGRGSTFGSKFPRNLTKRHVRVGIAASLGVALIGFLVSGSMTSPSEPALGAPKAAQPLPAALAVDPEPRLATTADTAARSNDDVPVTVAEPRADTRAKAAARMRRPTKAARGAPNGNPQALPSLVVPPPPPAETVAPAPSAERGSAWDPSVFGGRY